MKKLVLFAFSAILCLSAFAQRGSVSSLYSSENQEFTLNAVSHWGWGYSFVTSDEFKSVRSGEVFLNLLNLKLYPVEYFGVEAGLDCKWTYIGSKESMFVQNSDHLVRALPFSFPGMTIEKPRSQISVFSLSVPVLAKFVAGKFRIGGGAEANFNLVGDTFYRYRADGNKTKERERQLALNRFSYNFVGLVGIGNLTVFGKYYPKNSRMLPEGSVDFNYWTLGVAFAL